MKNYEADEHDMHELDMNGKPNLMIKDVLPATTRMKIRVASPAVI